MPINTENYKKEIALKIVNEITRQRYAGKKTSKGEKMSQAAIGRTLDPPVERVSVHQVINGHVESRRIKLAIERELGKAYWVIKNNKIKNDGKRVAV